MCVLALNNEWCVCVCVSQVMFKKLVFHLESPAGLIFPKVSHPDPLRCRNTGLFHAYRKHILHVS